MQTCLRINLSGYRYGDIPALEALEVSIPLNSLTAIIGPNGGGKSTFLKIAAGLLKANDSTISLPIQSIKDLAYLPQMSTFDRTFPLKVSDVVAMGLWPSIGLFRKLPKQMRSQISVLLEKVGLNGFEDRALTALSGGQMQRLLFARLMAQDAKIILLDEPFAAVDPATTQDLIKLIQQWHKDGKTIIAVLHDLTIVRNYFPHTLLLSKKVIAHDATENVLVAEKLAKAAFNV